MDQRYRMRVLRTSQSTLRLLPRLCRACTFLSAAAVIDRASISRVVHVFGVEVSRSRCSEFIKAAQPHVLSMNRVKSVRSHGENSRLVLLDAALQDENLLPATLQRAVRTLADSDHLQRVEVRLGYDDLGAQEVLQQLLPADVQVPTGFEQVGHIVHLNLRPEQRPHKQLIGQVLLDKLSPRIRTVVNKADEIQSEFRTLPLELLAGEDDFDVAVQHGSAKLTFAYDKVYWSSRLQTEHERIAQSFSPGCVVWDLFAGVGPFAVLAAQRGVRVLANDLNPDSCRALLANVASNRLRGLIHVYNLDAAAFASAATASVAQSLVIPALADGTATASLSVSRLPSLAEPAPRKRRGAKGGGGEEEGAGGRGGCVDNEEADAVAAAEAEASIPTHILLNLPADSIRFLGALSELSALLAAQPRGDAPIEPPMVHCYSFTREAEPEAQLVEAQARVAAAMGRHEPPADLSVRVVRSVAPGKEYVCVEFPLPV